MTVRTRVFGAGRGLLLLCAMAMPLAVPLGWLVLELRGATGRLEEAAAAAAAQVSEGLGEAGQRFDALAGRLRPPSSPTEASTLTGRLLRLEPQLAPASGLMVLTPQGRVAATSHPIGGGVFETSEAGWFRAMIDPAMPRLMLSELSGVAPVGERFRFVMTRRVEDAQGAVLGGVATFWAAEDLRRLTVPAWLAGRGEIRLTETGSGRVLVQGAALPAPAAPRWLVALEPYVARYGARIGVADVVSARVPVLGDAMEWRVTLAPWRALVAEGEAVASRGRIAAGLGLGLGLLIGLTALLAGRGRRARMPVPVPVMAGSQDGKAAGPAAAPPFPAILAPMPALPASGEAAGAEAEAERDRVLAAIGHDVRTPLNSILGIAALLLDGELEESQRQWVQRIRASCELLLAMLNGLLEASNAGADGAELNLDEVDVDELMREIGDVLRPQAHDKGLELRVAVDAPVMGAWMIDPTRVRQVLCNLLGNAIKYTDQGMVELRVSVLSTAEGEERLRVQVVDTGPGIEDGERGRIFERFCRGRGAVSGGREGVGLGLALCRDIALLMRGTLTVESTPGEGSSFCFEFPATRVAASDRRAGAPFVGRSALVVGLSEGVRRRMAAQLEGLGLAVETAGDGFIGLGMAERTAATQGALDLVVVDGALTGMPAEAFVIRLRASRQLQGAQIVWVAAANGPASAAADAVVRHPGEPQDVRQAVFGLLGATSALQAVDRDAQAPAQGRVLVVEDNKISQALLADVLRRAGFSVFTANDGEEAVRAVSRGGFDLCLMDVQMPGIGGIEATREIRDAEGEARRTPIVALTAHTGSTIRRRCKEAGADAVLHKPVNISRLPVQLREMIAAHRLEAPAEAAAEAGPLMIEAEYLEVLLSELGEMRAREVLRDFIADTGLRLPRLPELVAAGEWAAVRRGCHEISGIAGTLGAGSFVEAVAALDRCAEDGDAAGCEAALAAAERIWRATRVALQQSFESLAGAKPRGKAA